MSQSCLPLFESGQVTMGEVPHAPHSVGGVGQTRMFWFWVCFGQVRVGEYMQAHWFAWCQTRTARFRISDPCWPGCSQWDRAIRTSGFVRWFPIWIAIVELLSGLLSAFVDRRQESEIDVTENRRIPLPPPQNTRSRRSLGRLTLSTSEKVELGDSMACFFNAYLPRYLRFFSSLIVGSQIRVSQRNLTSKGSNYSFCSSIDFQFTIIREMDLDFWKQQKK